MADGQQYTCCQLARVAQESHDDRELSLLGLMLQKIWSYFSAKKSLDNVPPQEMDGIAPHSGALLGASISGCLSAFDYLLDVAQKDALSDVSVKEIVNARLPCDFPIPDSWMHKTVRLAMAPLHLACWRLDPAMIQKLLSLEADPNGLAWEEFGEILHSDENEINDGQALEDHFRLYVDGRPEGSETWVDLQGFEFDAGLGLSPLHFIALGLRSPPRFSLLDGQKCGIIHDVCADYEAASRMSSRTGDGQQPSFKSKPSQAYEGSDHLSRRCELVQECIKMLLAAGAIQNVGRATFLSFYYPLDIFIQPPIKVYFASRLARATQTPESLRRQNLELNLFPIVAAIQALLRNGSRLSDEFLFTHRWNLRQLDCFYTNQPQTLSRFLELLLLSGLFPDNGQILDPPTEYIDFITYFHHLKHACTTKDIRKFIIDVINVCPHEYLVTLIFKWCSLRIIQLFIETAKSIRAESQFPHLYLADLIAVAISHQLCPLKNLCKRIIVRSIGSAAENIDFLPLPPSLLRDLKVMSY